MSKKYTGRKAYLHAKIKDGMVVVAIGIDTLKFAAEHCPDVIDYPGEHDYPFAKITDADEFAKEVVRALQHEEEDGSGPMSDLFDKMIVAAMDDGADGVDYDFKPKRIVEIEH